MRKEWIEEIALRLTMKMLMNDSDLKIIVDKIMKLQLAENTIVPVLKCQLADVRSSIDNMLKAIEMGICNRSTKIRLDELEAEENRIEEDIYREQSKSHLVTEEQIWYIINKFRQMDLSMPKQRQRLLDSFLHSIILFDDKLIISFQYRSQPVTVMLDQLIEFLQDRRSDLKSSASPTNKNRLCFCGVCFCLLIIHLINRAVQALWLAGTCARTCYRISPPKSARFSSDSATGHQQKKEGFA